MTSFRAHRQVRSPPNPAGISPTPSTCGPLRCPRGSRSPTSSSAATTTAASGCCRDGPCTSSGCSPRQGVGSLLDRPLDQWLARRVVARGWTDHDPHQWHCSATPWRHLTDLAGASTPRAEFASDIWVAARLGHSTSRGHRTRSASTRITQPWLRDSAEALGPVPARSGKTFGSVDIDVRSMLWFAGSSPSSTPTPSDEAADLTRRRHRALPRLGSPPRSGTAHHQHLHHLPARIPRHLPPPRLAARAARHRGDLPRRAAAAARQPLPRFIPEFVMDQLEKPAEPLAVLPDDTTRAPARGHHGDRAARQRRLLAAVQPGHRRQRRLALPALPQRQDGRRAARAAQRPRAADTIRAQQAHLRGRWPDGPPVLFPSPHCNPDGTARSATPPSVNVSPAGSTTSTCATRPASRYGSPPTSSGTPSGPGSSTRACPSTSYSGFSVTPRPQMTARYASIHDTTVRRRLRRLPAPPRATSPASESPTTPGAHRRRRMDQAQPRPGRRPACPTATAAARPSRTARTPTPASPAPTSRPPQFLPRSPPSTRRHPNTDRHQPRQRQRSAWPPTTARSRQPRNRHRRPRKPSKEPTPMPGDSLAARRGTQRASQTRRRAASSDPPPRPRRPRRHLRQRGHRSIGLPSLLYRDPDLRAEIQRLRAKNAARFQLPAAQQATNASLKRRIEALLDEHEPSEPRAIGCAHRSPHSSASNAPARPTSANHRDQWQPRRRHVAHGIGPGHHRSGRDELQITVNLLIKKVRRVGHGYRKFDNYRLRLLLHCGVAWNRVLTPRIRTRRPRMAT